MEIFFGKKRHTKILHEHCIQTERYFEYRNTVFFLFVFHQPKSSNDSGEGNSLFLFN